MSDSGEKKDVAEAKASETTPAKKPYTAPKLRHLGSVRELTLGSPAGPCADGTTASFFSDVGNC